MDNSFTQHNQQVPTQPTVPPTMPSNFFQQPTQQPVAQKPQAAMPAKKKMSKEDLADLIKLIALIATSVLSVVFVALFAWKSSQYNELEEDFETKVELEVATAKDEQAEALEKEFANREKFPYKIFAGPADYGELTFNYPKTWSVYVSADASNGGEFRAYLNPGEIVPVNAFNPLALRIFIKNESFESVNKTYEEALKKKDSDLKTDTININGVTATRYTGTIPDTENLNGIVVLFKIRDKTVIMQTDSILFEGDYNALLHTVKFNS